MKKWIAKVMGWKYVCLRDYDGELTYRFAKLTPYGWQANRMTHTKCMCFLREGGKVEGTSWVHEWREVE